MNQLMRGTRLLALLPLLVLLTPSLGHAFTAAPKVTTSGLLHNSWSSAYRSPFGAVPAGTAVRLRLRTARTGVDRVDLVTRQVDIAGKQVASKTLRMKTVSRSSRYAYWQANFTPPSVGVYRYFFRLRHGTASAWYSSLTNSLGGTGRVCHGTPLTSFELTAYDRSFKAPSWARDAVIYQIFPDRFYNGDTANDTEGMDPVYEGKHPVLRAWSDLPSTDPAIRGFDFFGGDLQGVIDKLPYLKGLGINTIYLNPIFLAPSNHKYDTANYMEIDPRFGTLDTFKSLLAAAREAGIRVILDGVFNHTGSDSIYFNRFGHFPDVGAYQSQSSPYSPWYTFTSWPTFYRDWSGDDTLPQLNENAPVEDFIFRKPDSVAQYWASLGTGGWRLDAADQKSHAWWQAFRSSFKAAYPDDIMIGEATGGPIDAIPWLLGNEMDGVMNYRFRDDLLGFFAHGQDTQSGFPLTASGFFGQLMSMVEEYPRDALYSSINLVDSHDTTRILTDLGGNKAVLKEVATFQMTWLGAPTVYYGDESGLLGGKDPDDRRTFPWSSQDSDLEAFYRTVIGIRNAHPALRDGTITPLVLDDAHSVVAFMRKDSADQVAVVLNNGSSAQTVTLKGQGSAALTDALTGARYTPVNGTVQVSVGAASEAILAPSR
jgi:glycosidase